MDKLERSLRGEIAARISEALNRVPQSPIVVQILIGFCNKLTSSQPLDPADYVRCMHLAGYSFDAEAYIKPGQPDIQYRLDSLGSGDDVN